MLLLAFFLVAVTTIADFIGAGVVVRGLYRPAVIRLVVNFAVGTLLAVALLHLLPEALELLDTQTVMLFVLLGILGSFLFERLVARYHCHDGKCEAHPGSPGRRAMLLAGSSFEEFIDGAVVGLAVAAAAATQNFSLALLTTLAVFAHELPETASKVVTLTTFGVPAKKAMFMILATALMGFPGAGIAVFASETFTAALPFLLALAAGTFLYIATADLIPALHHIILRKSFAAEIVLMFLGVVVVLFIGMLGV